MWAQDKNIETDLQLAIFVNFTNAYSYHLG